MSYREVVTQGKKLVGEISTRQWKLGDLALTLDPGILNKFAHDIQLEESTLRQYRTTAGAWPKSQRQAQYSWTVHYRLSNVPDRFKVIRSRNAWTTREAQVAAGNKPSLSRESNVEPSVAALLSDVDEAQKVLRDPATRAAVARAAATDPKVRAEFVRASRTADAELEDRSRSRAKSRSPRVEARSAALDVIGELTSARYRVNKGLERMRDLDLEDDDLRESVLEAARELQNSVEWVISFLESGDRSFDAALDRVLAEGSR